MKSTRRVHLKQPPTKKKVVEVLVGGKIGRWFEKNQWGAFTLPLPFLVLIVYWATDVDVLLGEQVFSQPDAKLTRVHEFTHVAQDERNLFFLVSWCKYIWAMWKAFAFKAWRHHMVTLKQALMDAYFANQYEAEAYQVEDDAATNGLPDWVK